MDTTETVESGMIRVAADANVFVIPTPSFSGEECPFVPDGATDWERQEIVAAWRQVHRHATDAMARIASVFGNDHKMPDAHPFANDVSAVAQFTAARALLQGRIDGCEHRLSCDRVRLNGDPS